MSEITEPQMDLQTRAFELMRSKLGPEGINLLQDQLDTWAELNERQIDSPLKIALVNGDTTLPEGTLLHGMGMYGFNPEALRSVSEKGIVSGELTGTIEDSETHGCADFFRTPSTTTIGEYFARAKERLRSGENGNMVQPRAELLLTRGVAFIVDPQAEGLDRLLENDGYRNSAMTEFVSPPGNRTAEDTAAILGGVPRGTIAGIIVNDRFLARPEVAAAIGEYFPDLPLFTQDGTRQLSPEAA